MNRVSRGGLAGICALAIPGFFWLDLARVFDAVALLLWPVLLLLTIFGPALQQRWWRPARPWRLDRGGQFGAGVVVWMGALVALAPMLSPYDPEQILGLHDGCAHSGIGQWLAPMLEHPMGTDHHGRDVMARVLHGGRISLAISLVAVGIAVVVGTCVGAAAGFLGGWVDTVLGAVIDLLLSLPRLVLLLAIIGVLELHGSAGTWMMAAILGLTGWMAVARVVRAEVLSLSQREFVLAARALGLRPMRIVFRHLSPNALSPVIVFASLAVGTTMLTEAGLSFLGLGVQPPSASWGSLVADGRYAMLNAPWMATIPGVCIAFVVTGFNLLGDGLRDVLDPTLAGPAHARRGR